MARLLALLALCLALGAAPASAHKLKIFATAVGERIEGKIYFVGGGVVPGAKLQLQDAKGQKLAEVTADQAGRFALTRSGPGAQVLVADLGDGHVARLALPAAGAAAPVAGSAAVGTAPGAADAQLPALLEQAVARQIEPLRAQLNDYEDQLRLRDILGGLAFIIGLAGTAAWVKAGQRRAPPP